MYLLNITNLDYALMTLLFAILVAMAYLFRRRNLTSRDFLLMETSRIPALVNLLSISSVGLLEFSLVSSYGAYAGLSALCLALPLYLIFAYVFELFSARDNLFSSLSIPPHKVNGNGFILVCYGLFMLIVAGVAISLVVGLLKSLLGWEFGNSTLSLLGVALVCMLIGGVAGSYYQQMLTSVIAGVLLFVVALFAYQAIGATNLLANLAQVAKDNQLVSDYFTNLGARADVWQQVWLIILAIIMVLLINPMSYYKKLKFTAKPGVTKSWLMRLLQLILLLIFLAVGILALATPPKQTLIAGKKIITSQTRLPSGELGYVVRAIPSDQVTAQRGLIPLHDSANLTPDSQAQLSSDSFDYFAAGLVLIKTVLPYAFICLFIVVLLFFKSLSEAISFVNLVAIRGFYAPKFNKSTEELENLWAARVFMLMFIVISVCIGLLFFKFFALSYLFMLVLLFALPLFLHICGLSRSWVIDCIAYLALIGCLCLLNVPGLPAAYPLISFHDARSALIFLTLATTIYYAVTAIAGRLTSTKR